MLSVSIVFGTVDPTCPRKNGISSISGSDACGRGNGDEREPFCRLRLPFSCGSHAPCCAGAFSADTFLTCGCTSICNQKSYACVYKLHYKQTIGTLSIIISGKQAFFRSSADSFADMSVDVVENSVDKVEIWWYYIICIGIYICKPPCLTCI